MSMLKEVPRYFLGLIFVVFGLNYFLNFIALPPMTPEAMSFMGALMETGYMLPLVKIIEVVAGLMLLSGLFVPLALVLLAPIVVNILLLHLFLDVGGLIMSVVLTLALLYEAKKHMDCYTPMLCKKCKQ